MTLSSTTSSLLKVKMAALHAHPAQMRTVYSLEAMAELTLQVLVNQGIDTWNPIVVTPTPDNNGYYVVSGHRRRMATLFSWAVELYLSQQPEPEVRRAAYTLEEMQAFLQTLLTKYEDIESAADAVALKFAERMLEVAHFEGDPKSQILALQRANYGSETPDVLGIAHSFRAALDSGASETEIARNIGQPPAFVYKHLALTRIPLELADLIAAGKVPMSVAGIVAELHPESARNGMALFVVTNVGQVTADGLKSCARAVTGWHQFGTMPMTLAHQGQRNMIRILANLWQTQVNTTPVQTWANAVMLIYRGINHGAPWENQAAYAEWIRVLGGDLYYQEPTGIRWEPLIRDHLTTVSCEQCPLVRLPERVLLQDLSDRPGALGRPCRTAERSTYSRCINGFATGDPLDVRVPFAWADHPGVTKQGQFYTVLDTQSLDAAWQTQATTEDAVTAQEEAASIAQGTDEGANTTAPSPHTPKKTTQAAAPSNTKGTPPPETAPNDGNPEKADAPIAKMRAQITAYMHSHLAQAVSHPFATPCSGCQHRLTQSPTKDTSVPHCAWAGRLRSVYFLTLQDATKQIAIPVCRQYAPNRPWQELIPAHLAPVPLPRDYLISQIRLHVKEADRAGNTDRHPFEFLTGRPLGSESYTHWFETQFTEQVGSLSDTHLFTLFVWSLSEYERARHANTFTLPTDAQTSGFITVAELSRSVS
jgi:hypothetical protein